MVIYVAIMMLPMHNMYWFSQWVTGYTHSHGVVCQEASHAASPVRDREGSVEGPVCGGQGWIVLVVVSLKQKGDTSIRWECFILIIASNNDLKHTTKSFCIMTWYYSSLNPCVIIIYIQQRQLQ